MISKLRIIAVITLFPLITSAQTFIDKVSVEYEVKTNLKKSLGGGMWQEMMKENLPQFNTGYYTFTAVNNKTSYQFSRWENGAKLPKWMTDSDEKEYWRTDLSTGRLEMEKDVAGTLFPVHDSLPELKWQISNERRTIAGFDCRKAVAKIFDSVYIFAFYTDELMINGGPQSVSGLPGLILGMTVPRLYTSWIATKVSVTDVNEALLQSHNPKKTYSMKEFGSIINERTKEWFGDGDGADKAEAEQQQQRFVWNLLL